MFTIVDKQQLNDVTYLFRIEAPDIARAHRPGQFVIVHANEHSERIPLSVADVDHQAGTISIVVQVLGHSTQELSILQPGEALRDVVGPLGRPTHVENFGRAAFVGGGVGCATGFLIAKALKDAGNHVTSIIGFRTKSLIIFQDKLARISDRLIVATDDGSYGKPGLVTDVLAEVLDEAGLDYVIAVGPVPMMAAVARTTAPYGVKTVASLNPIMVDGTGMCGACRVTVGGQTRFACVDGPEFDAHQVDFGELAARLKMYSNQEHHAAETGPHECKLESVIDNLKQSRVEVTPAQRTRILHQKMPEQPPEVRIRNFDEVNLGYSLQQAITEASRCLQCKTAPCRAACPVNIDIPTFIALLREKKFDQAVAKILEDNAFPAICGRVCPQERQCQAACVLGKKGDPVGIGHLERFLGDWLMANEAAALPEAPPPRSTGRKVAVVGSGPSGLTVAGDLARMGHQVTIFEALHAPGGVMVFGIPQFRLPKEIVAFEIGRLQRLGVEIRTNVVIGKTLTIDQLMNELHYDAVFLGLGAGSPVFMGLPGENLRGICSANEFLTRVNLMRAYRDDYDTPIRKGRRVAVIGGGNTAMDASRCAIRLGAEEVILVYRRSRAEMPARVEEIRHAEEEGVNFQFLTNPVRFIGQEDVQAMECIRMELGEPGPDGRRRPRPISGSEFIMEVDEVIIAIGARVSPLAPLAAGGARLDDHGRIITDPQTLATTRPGVFAGGDVIGSEETVIAAMRDGRKAAKAIDDYLRTLPSK